MKTISAILAAALLAAPSVAHVAIKPPNPDKWLTPNSSTAPEGCKLLASDKGFPSEDEVLKAFPKAFRKMKGTEGPDFWIQPQSVEEVQKAVNFAREKNIRLNVITSGHDFHGREDQRSGLRLDMAAFIEPTVFSNEWKCGDTLKPKVNGKHVDTIACKVPSKRDNVGHGIAGRNWDYVHFVKRDGAEESCETLLKRSNRLGRRHGPDADDHAMPAAKEAPTGAKKDPVDQKSVKFNTAKPYEWAQKTGFENTAPAQIVDSYNKITPLPGKGAYVRVTAGMYNEKLYSQAHEMGLMTLGAQHGGVSTLGGWMQAGGHNPFAHKQGMMVDNVLEIEVVTTDGKFQKVSECNNPELYWALRGGGGGTFGVVTGATIRAFPTFPVTVARFFVNATEPYDYKLMKAVGHFLQKGAHLRDTYGLQGYFYVYPNAFHSVLHMPDEFAKLDNAKKAVAEIQGEMEKIAGGKHIEPNFYEHKSYKAWYVAEMGDEAMEESGEKFHSWYDGAWGDAPSAEDVMMNPMLVIPYRLQEAKLPKQANKMKRDVDIEAAAQAATSVLRTQPQGRTYLDSRLLSDKQVNSVSIDDLAKAVNATFPRTVANHFRGFLYGGGAQAKPAKDAMGLLPDWRDMTFHFIINALPGSSRHDYNIRAFDKIFPDAGAYVNEASPGEPQWKKKFWGSHYEKLESIKKKVDPNNVLWCSPCVGADLLSYDDERLCKNKAYPQAGSSPQTYENTESKIGIASLPGVPGIPNPLLPIIQGWMANKTLPTKMPASNFFKMAMGQGGSSGGRWSVGEPAAKAGGAPEGHGHGGMEGMEGMGGMGHGAAPAASPAPISPSNTEHKDSPDKAPPAPVASAPAAPAAASPAASASPKPPKAPKPPRSKGKGKSGGLMGWLTGKAVGANREEGLMAADYMSEQEAEA
ncbi:hypothetical protein BT63DRAFT_204108 [Microthyrium microscopicum]|uniref:FAD-binding PCMH-type domain-containing protein n=1 Tax=Microthyrium microscopicum TaxID=703497 RepID=A0A6A6UFH3_9PEZI|nr:hypothetical protein BT63DRAFT_204108 [Microthyrium microscopicum]